MLRLSKMVCRRPVRRCVRAWCQVVRERDFRLIADSLEDLSVEGARVGPADAVLTGEVLLFSFKIPYFDLWIDTEAVVSRVLHGRRPGESSRSLGLEFCGLAPWDHYLLQQALTKIPSAPLGPRPGRRVPLSPRAIASLLPAVQPC